MLSFTILFECLAEGCLWCRWHGD